MAELEHLASGLRTYWTSLPLDDVATLLNVFEEYTRYEDTSDAGYNSGVYAARAVPLRVEVEAYVAKVRNAVQALQDVINDTRALNVIEMMGDVVGGDSSVPSAFKWLDTQSKDA